MSPWALFVAGLALTAVDWAPWTSRTLLRNVTKRVVIMVLGLAALFAVAPSYLIIGWRPVSLGVLVGGACLLFHVAIAGGVKLRRADVTPGMAKTAALIYLLELPAEEVLYRGLLFVSALPSWGLWPAVTVSSALFFGLHVKTWKDPAVWAGSAILAVICALAVAGTGSLWTAVLIHDLNDFGFITLVRRRNLFT